MLCVRQIVFVRTNAKIFGASDWVKIRQTRKTTLIGEMRYIHNSNTVMVFTKLCIPRYLFIRMMLVIVHISNIIAVAGNIWPTKT